MDPASIAGAVRGEIRSMDVQLPVPQFRPMRAIVAQAFGERRFQLELVVMFALVGLVLASLGIYGVVSYSVGQRKGEMGIRMALGATGAELRRMVLMESLRPWPSAWRLDWWGLYCYRELCRDFCLGWAKDTCY